MEDKKELRKIMLDKRNMLNFEDKIKYDKVIYDSIIERDLFINSKNIFIFVSYQNEVDTRKIIQYGLEHNKNICVPKIISKSEGMISIKIKSFDELEKSKYGILEPKSNDNIVKPEDIDLILLPGLAFDFYGGRLGYGGGFYDRYLKAVSKESIKLGITYNFQIIPKVPVDEHDYLVDGVITDKDTYLFENVHGQIDNR